MIIWLRVPGAYYIQCLRGMVYVGQTGRMVTEHCIEYLRYIRLNHSDKSSLAEYCLTTGHEVSFDQTVVLF